MSANAVAVLKPKSSKRREWGVPDSAARNPDELNFTTRVQGRQGWWDVDLPRTPYNHPHEALGRAYAFELLDLINNPQGDCPAGVLAYIAESQRRWARTTNDPTGGAVLRGFWMAISEYLVKGSTDR